MFNKLSNFRKASVSSFLMQSAVYAGIIYATITYIHYRPEVIVREVEEWITLNQTTDEKGLYINHWRIPLEDLKPGKLAAPLLYEKIKIPYGLNFFLDDKHMEVYVYSKGIKADNEKAITNPSNIWSLEAILKPQREGNEGKDGLSFQGELADEYLLKIVRYDNNIGTNDAIKTKEEEGGIEIAQTSETDQFLLKILVKENED